MARKNIYDKDFLYDLVFLYAHARIPQAYRRYKMVGFKENYPLDGSVILAPNHANCLMDPLNVLIADWRPKAFVARADIFRNPTAFKALSFLRMMPIMRKRDGMEEVAKNDDIIAKSIDLLQHGLPFCILPEGAHQPKHSMLPLGKGIFRVALGALDGMPEGEKLYILPIGLEYSDYFRYRGDMLMTVGKPIDVTALRAENPDTPAPVLINRMKADLSQRMKDLILYIPNDEYYDATYAYCCVKSEGLSQIAELESKRAAAAKVADLRANNPEGFAELMDKAGELAEGIKEHGIDPISVSHRSNFCWHIVRAIITVVLFPYLLACAVLSAPVTIAAQKISLKMKDSAFRNSIRFAVNLAWPVLFIIYSIVLFCCLPWKTALIAAVLLHQAPNFTHDTIRAWRLLKSDIRLRKSGLLKKVKELEQD